MRSGDVVAILDYDTARYLEGFFAIPMMGAVLQTVNWRLSPDQILYTLQHAEAKYMIVHADFLPLVETLENRLTQIKTIITVQDAGTAAAAPRVGQIDYEEMLQAAPAHFHFPDG